VLVAVLIGCWTCCWLRLLARLPPQLLWPTSTPLIVHPSSKAITRFPTVERQRRQRDAVKQRLVFPSAQSTQ